MCHNHIAIENVTFTYPGGEKPVLSNISFTLEKGDFVGIIGGNGSGKSTLCKLLNGIIPHYYVGDFSGRVMINELDTREHKVADLSRYVGYVYQDFENQIVRPTVIDDASFACLNYGYADYRERGARALELAQLNVNLDEFVWQLSGGQKHLLALAGALSLDPDILIVDEPVAQLDPVHARLFYDILKDINKNRGTTIIVIEHHTEFIADYCHHVLLMNEGQLVWKKETKHALNEVEQLMKYAIFPPQVTQAAYQLNMKDSPSSYPITCDEAIKLFKQPESMFFKSTFKKEVPFSPTRESIISMTGIDVSYKTVSRKKHKVIHDLSLSFEKGDLIALVGNNGAGKSSLLKLLTGLIKPDKGDVVIKDFHTKTTSPEKLANIVTYIYQNPEDMFIEDSIRKDIEFYLKARKVANYQSFVDEIIRMFRLEDIQERDGRLLSGGQQRRASVAIGVAMQPHIILLDEPTANLDIATKKDITHMLSQLQEQVETVIIATHDMQLVAEWANRIIVLHEGKVLHDGTRESVFSNTPLLKKAGLIPPQILELSKDIGGSSLSYSVDDFVNRWKLTRKEVDCCELYAKASR
ncbi:ABC transporter ATP-binding protein [Salipaludibacillus agaradhaerens]|uniref:ABC transporter ATP-binding protein n=1 Tax=Salipaludibacillus agaradhaerens TaxID=76935 RepID=UPI002150A9D6|nr:energy-coupling factor transporter ATPase [Salipaludibacillus agaradhaerens]MCR6106885.1 ABC transporter ATP-binding protein [Salipaludibacillus agaradhaerens]MCR6118917.1 ABC transporter ATP-binding protein [Salipaludibacillus agaradhaerens]